MLGVHTDCVLAYQNSVPLPGDSIWLHRIQPKVSSLTVVTNVTAIRFHRSHGQPNPP
jgi:hypothetical protein